MEIYTIGFTKKTAADFFNALRRAGVKRILDIRLNNSSQLAGFTKRENLPFLLKEICDAEYMHEPLLAPTRELLSGYRKKKVKWPQYEEAFRRLMAERKIEDKIDRTLFSIPTALLCSEATADRCHRRVVVEYLQSKWGNLEATHL